MKYKRGDKVIIHWSSTEVEILDIQENTYLVKEVEKNGIKSVICFNITENMIKE
jgi:hypothetical protein